ncbi:MAG: ATP-binding protein [Spirochaetales bacterium]|nr:ATP-binding protein [Spirochaetales bacterium]
MIDSFFVPSFGNRPKHLVGRDSVLRRIEMALQSVPGSRERAMIILGQRGSGKTVLLLEIAERAKKKRFIVANPTVVSNGMRNRIMEKLRDECPEYLNETRKKVAGGNVSVLGFGAGIQFNEQASEEKSFSWKITEYCKNANADHHGVMILIDEVRSNSEELRELIISYQEMVGEGLDVSIVFAGLPMAISTLLNDHVLTFLNRAEKIELQPLRTEDIELYYLKAFESLGVEISREKIRLAAEEAAGSPYLMQLIGHYITLNSEGKMSESQFTDSLEYAKRTFKNDICRTSIAPLSDLDIGFLNAMVEDADETNLDDITIRMGKTASFVQTYKRRLIQCGIIEQPRRGKVVFAIPYLKEYLREQA